MRATSWRARAVAWACERRACGTGVAAAMETARKAIVSRNRNCRQRFRSRATGIFFIGVSTLRTDPARILLLGLVSKRSDHVCPISDACIPSGAKTRFQFAASTARLKTCPDTKHRFAAWLNSASLHPPAHQLHHRLPAYGGAL